MKSKLELTFWSKDLKNSDSRNNSLKLIKNIRKNTATYFFAPFLPKLIFLMEKKVQQSMLHIVCIHNSLIYKS
ncbi:hypothetical protein BpHYR1_042470 [Brachionus plicatilis]|uniref:Uncharacterized protein n=1 Tax=Brachionus plicatilis TaxID=10195 RepID=A0A3M7PD26_BRAPC|nr:hypothetical protein BpHYR1_042470 [Brachionus plicatilis]